MSNSRPGSVYANGVTKALAEPNQTLLRLKAREVSLGRKM